MVVKMVMSTLPVAFLCLIPTKKATAKIQMVIAYMEELEKKVDERDYAKMNKLIKEIDPAVAERMGVKLDNEQERRGTLTVAPADSIVLLDSLTKA